MLQVPAELGYKEIFPLFSTALDDRGYMVAVYEANCGLQQGCQTSIYGVDADAVKIRWRAKSVGGQLRSAHVVTTLRDTIVAFSQTTTQTARVTILKATP